MSFSLATGLAVLVCLGTCTAAWYRDSRMRFVFTPCLLVLINESFRNLPAGFVAVAAGVSQDDRPLLIMVTALLAFSVGYLCVSYIVGIRGGAAARFAEREVYAVDGPAPIVLVGGLMTALGIVGLLLYRGIPPVASALSSVVTGGMSSDVAAMVGENRQLITKGHYFGAEYRGQGAMRAVMQVGWPMVTCMAWVNYVASRRRAWRWLFFVGVALTFVFVAGDGTRGPFLWAIVYFVVVGSLMFRIEARHLLSFAAVFLAVAICISALSPKLHTAVRSGNVIKEGVARIAERILLGNGVNTVHAIELVHRGIWGLRGGDVHVGRLKAALPGVGSGEPFAYELYRAMNPEGTRTTYLTATYIADVYVDFGPPGVPVAYFFWGVLLGVLQPILFGIRKTAFNLPVLAMVFLYAGQFTLTGPVGVAVSAGIAVVLYTLLLFCYSAAVGGGRRAAFSSPPVVRQAGLTGVANRSPIPDR